MPKKTPIESASCHLAEARRRWCILIDDETISSKHKRCMKVAMKSLDKAMAKLVVAAPKKRGQAGGMAPIEGMESGPIPGQLDASTVVSNTNGLTVASHNPMGAEALSKNAVPLNMPQPFSTNKDPSLHYITGGLDTTTKNIIVPNLGGYQHNAGTTQMATLSGGSRRPRRRNASKAK